METLLYGSGGNRCTPINRGESLLCRTYRELEVEFYQCQVKTDFFNPFSMCWCSILPTYIRLDLLDLFSKENCPV